MLGDAVRWLSLASLGVFLGAMLTEGCVLVPYWRTLDPADFLVWYAANDQRLLAFFGPLTTATALLAIAAAAVSWWQGHSRASAAGAAALLIALTVAMFFVYFESANRSFAAASIAPADVPAELARWAAWHWLRTGLAALAFAAALITARK